MCFLVVSKDNEYKREKKNPNLSIQRKTDALGTDEIFNEEQPVLIIPNDILYLASLAVLFSQHGIKTLFKNLTIS